MTFPTFLLAALTPLALAQSPALHSLCDRLLEPTLTESLFAAPPEVQVLPTERQGVCARRFVGPPAPLTVTLTPLMGVLEHARASAQETDPGLTDLPDLGEGGFSAVIDGEVLVAFQQSGYWAELRRDATEATAGNPVGVLTDVAARLAAQVLELAAEGEPRVPSPPGRLPAGAAEPFPPPILPDPVLPDPVLPDPVLPDGEDAS